MKAMKCDRCGKFYEPYQQTGKYSDGTETPKYAINFNSVLTFTDNKYQKTFDLCPKCATAFNKWLNTKRI